MRSSDEPPVNDDTTLYKRKEHSLFFLESVDGRTYLRFTRWAVILIIGLTVVSIVSILVIFLMSSQQSATEPGNVNVTVPSRLPSPSNKPILRQPAPQSQPPKVAKPSHGIPATPNTPQLNKNSNGQTVPRQAPQSLRSESPP
jgi:hypothetical protein